MKQPRTPPTALARFTAMSTAASADVIRSYSTSFGLATNLLGKRHRSHVRNIYAMVRIADEIVDGVASEAGLSVGQQEESLAEYIAATHRAMRTGYSTNIVLHAFAQTARESGITEELTQPFFDSMAADLVPEDSDAPHGFDEQSHSRYVYGSAEVVGLMCVQVFLRESKLGEQDRARVVQGARQLGAAFQNVNFLRDLADDTERLHRGYLSEQGRLTDDDRKAWVQTVRGQLDDAREVICLLPKDARAAVRSALGLFEALTDTVATTPVATLYRERVRVPDVRKALIAAKALAQTAKEKNR